MATPFLALLGGTIQVAFMIWAQQNLDVRFQRAVRNIFTGQLQMQNTVDGLGALRTAMCSNAGLTLFSCSAANLKLDVRLGTSFANATAAAPVDPSTKQWASGFGSAYSCAAPNTIVVATAAVEFPTFFNFLNASVAKFADGGTLLVATSVFRTEPYATQGNSPC